MRRMFIGCLLGLLMLAVSAAITPAKALVVAPSPLPDRVANASIIVVGKVTAVEEKTVSARPAPGANPIEYQVAVVKIDEALLGAKGLTHIRVGFTAPVAPPPPPPGGIRLPIRSGVRSPALAKDQEVCLFLTPMAGQSFFTAPMYFDVIDKKSNPNFDKELAQIRRTVKIMADPRAGLQSKEESDRLAAVSLLLSRYRTIKGPVKGTPKQEPIDAEESKLILRALAETDWARPVTPMDPAPRMLFYRLGVQAKDGWTPPKNAQELPAAAKKWLTANADKFRIQRYVTETAEK